MKFTIVEPVYTEVEDNGKESENKSTVSQDYTLAYEFWQILLAFFPLIDLPFISN